MSRFAFATVTGFLLAYVSVRFNNSYNKSPVVEISTGKVQGIVSYSRNDRIYFEYLGIPFAQPPVGDLRFKSPLPAQPWSGVLETYEQAPPCLGIEFMILEEPIGEESCLFLNVMTPRPFNDSKLLPVIVAIHGGGFQTGENEPLKGKYFLDEDVVLIRFSYRVGIFGFLTTGDSVIRGNMGLKDQVLVLKWVQTNIKQFGGDPHQVTIIGFSAGGISAHLLMLSEMSKGLFHRAISCGLGGTSDVSLMNSSQQRQISAVAEHFNCPTPSEELANCLRGIPASQLLAFQNPIGFPKYYKNDFLFWPIVEAYHDEETFLKDLPVSLLKKGKIANKVPWMFGVNTYEGLPWVGKLLQYPEFHGILKDPRSWNEHIDHLAYFNSTLRPDASDKIRDHYFQNKSMKLNSHEGILAVEAIVSDKLMKKPLYEAARLQSQVSPVYLYLLEYPTVFVMFEAFRGCKITSWMNRWVSIMLHYGWDVLTRSLFWWKSFPYYGPSHADEIRLLFNASPLSDILTYFFELDMSRVYVKTIVDFASNKNPVKYNNILWPKIEPTKPLQFMRLHPTEPQVVTDPFGSKVKFWEELGLPQE